MNSHPIEEKKDEGEHRINQLIDRSGASKRSAVARIRVRDEAEFRRWEEIAKKLAEKRRRLSAPIKDHRK
jgi:hypothetical protein